ncbi:hypothetical protein [Halobaculum sp. D14]|uniref:hypothetical protein n=1 Tax=Halobaculum sp. D14 TaxID=3421642 RepID=UPI003EC14AA5
MIELIDHAGVIIVHTVDRAGREAWYTAKRHPAPPNGGRVEDILIDVDGTMSRYTKDCLRERGIGVVGPRAARPQRYAPEYQNQATADG